jgi:hypothetical protein
MENDMKNIIKKYFETGLFILCAAGFFGFIYPELVFIEETVVTAESGEPHEFISDSRFALPPEQIRFRFRIWDTITGNK